MSSSLRCSGHYRGVPQSVVLATDGVVVTINGAEVPTHSVVVTTDGVEVPTHSVVDKTYGVVIHWR